MFTSIISAIAALPEIFKALSAFWAWLQKISGNDPAGLIAKAHDAFTQAANAKTDEDRANAAQAISNLIRGA